MACRRFLLTPVTLLHHNYPHHPKTQPPFQLIQRTYKSSISIDKLYPNSDEGAFTKVVQPPQNEANKFSGFIPMEKLTITYSRSSGPGGMNVNKLNTKATVQFKVSEADWIPDGIKTTFIDKFKNQLTKEGTLTIQSDRTRYQHLNTADALQKLREMIRACEPVEKVASVDDIEKARRLREKAARERLVTKRRRSDLKGSRGAV